MTMARRKKKLPTFAVYVRHIVQEWHDDEKEALKAAREYLSFGRVVVFKVVRRLPKS
jgi:hypothetical protein